MSSSHASSWFHIKLIYARLSGNCCCATTSRDAAAAAAPESLCLRFPPRSIGTALEVNGGRISPSEQPVLVLRREKRRTRRSDPESAEATSLSTDDVRTSGPLSFEILFKDEALVAGTITLEQHSVSDSLQQQGGDDGVYNSSSLEQKNSIDGLRRWSLDCACVVVGHAGSIFSKLRRHDHNIPCPSSSSSSPLSPPAMEVCLVARNLGTPVILIQTVHLTAPRRRSSCRQSTLEAIPEAEEVGKRSNLTTMTITEQQPKLGTEANPLLEVSGKAAAGLGYALEGGGYDLTEKASAGLGYELEESGYGGGEDDRQLTWFNAGVRVGVGLGLGMCLGIGIGVGLIVHTYHATSRTLRKGFI
ncbi:unnamed protein product [Sphagnum jensenii]|uniref:Uncharacterized protein n=1 Tax=Sphagnum jensenii TaxID=128206 RepID=A0ABP0W6J8_9BRYO